MKELIQRGIFGLVFLLFVFAPFIVDLKNNTNIFNFTLYAFAMLSTYELFKMAKNTEFPSNLMFPALLFNTALFLPMLLETLRGLFPEMPFNPIWTNLSSNKLLITVVVICSLSIILFSTLTFIKGSIEAIFKLNFGLNALYISVPLALLSFAYTMSPGVGPMATKPLLLLVLVPIYLNDTFAYISGRLFGKHLMFPTVSPKKTWEGFIGGAIIAALTMVTILYFTQTENTTSMEFIALAAVSLSVSVLATLGDFFESRLKRAAKTKDSGSILPGHGGILDRIDAMLFAAPIMFVILAFF